MKSKDRLFLIKGGIALLLVLLTATSAFALEGENYGQLMGLDSRKVVWFFAQLHLFFGAFVLGVPLFAVIIEIVGWKKGERKFDALSREFTGLLSLAYGATALFGAILTLALLKLYPSVVGYMAGIFKDGMSVYALLFFAETFCLYLYYYGWDRLSGGEPFGRSVTFVTKSLSLLVFAMAVIFFSGGCGPEMRTDTRTFITLFYLLPLSGGLYIVKDRKSLHILIGILLNISGTAILQMANSWVGFMMSPVGIDASGAFTGTLWQAFENRLATPIAIHRMLGNLVFGGLVAGSYAAVKFMGARTDAEKAHYDWMGYVSNFVAVAALIPLPFAGYYLGREIYSTSAVMGNNMMGGDFSWTFIIQAMLVGSLFLISNYYLWCGMTRIPGAERYYKYIKFILGALVISFAVWVTPHNLPLTGGEVSAMGGSRYHPTLKFLGLMPAKNAVVNLIILSTFFSFLLYRRGNKGELLPIGKQGALPKIAIPLAGLLSIAISGAYALYLFGADPGSLGLTSEASGYFRTTGYLLLSGCVVAVASVLLVLAGKGLLAEYLYLGFTACSVTGFLSVYGFIVMEKASPFLRNIAVSQFLQLISCILLVGVIDFFLFRGAKVVGELKWGNMTARSQYALLFLTIVITLTMGLMGFVRSGLRSGWHIYGVMRDTSPFAYTPDNATMAEMVSLTVFVFLLSLAFIFWLGGKKNP